MVIAVESYFGVFYWCSVHLKAIAESFNFLLTTCFCVGLMGLF